jgi:predicted Zn-dependent protease
MKKLSQSFYVSVFSLIISTIASSIFLSGCAVNPVTGRSQLMLVSEEKEFEIGKGVDKEVRDEMGIYLELPELRTRLKEVADNLGKNSDRPDLVFRAEIVDTPDFNAFAVPGGFVYVHRGLLEKINSEDELASVMAHEIAHVAARHSASQISKNELLNIGIFAATVATGGALQNYGSLVDMGSILAFSKFSRDDEREADRFGLKYMTKAGYNPSASIAVMKEIQGLETSKAASLDVWFMTHPPTAERIANLSKDINSLASNTPDLLKRKDRRNDFIRLLNGMAMGDWNGSELVSGEYYYNKEFQLRIPVPEGWQVAINNSDHTAVFYDEKQESFVYFNIQALQKQKTSRVFFSELSDTLVQNGFKKVSDSYASKTLTNEAMAGLYQRTSGTDAISAVLFAFTKNNNGYSILGAGKKESFSRIQPLIEQMSDNLKFLSRAEANEIAPPRMKIHEVSTGETWDKIAEGYYKTSTDKKKLAEYNGMAVEQEPPAGTVLKIPPTLRVK